MEMMDSEDLIYYDDFISNSLAAGRLPEDIRKDCTGYTDRQFDLALERCRNGLVAHAKDGFRHLHTATAKPRFKPQKKRKSRANHARDKKMVEMYKAGVSAQEIAERVGYTHANTVFIALRRLGVPTHRELRKR